MTDRKSAFRGDRLKEVRLAHGYSQETLNILLRTGKGNQVNRYETGKHAPTVDILYRMVIVLGVSADYLLGVTDNRYHPYERPAVTMTEQSLLTVINQSSSETRAWMQILLSVLSNVLRDGPDSTKPEETTL